MHQYIISLSRSFLFVLGISTLTLFAFSPPQAGIQIALVKYNGGGDWYSIVDALENLANFCNKNLGTNLDPNYATVEVGSADVYNYPFLFMTGHGNVVFSDQEAENLRNYLMAGGFIFIDDDYGMDPFIRPALKKVFPEQELVELPFEHPIYHQKYKFENGMPKTHEHDGKAPRGYGLFHEGRLVCYYATESNISDGWESQAVHKDPEEIRQISLKMGANIIQYSFQQ
jgi:hypothetical protein